MELKDVADKHIDLEEALYPSDKSKCQHIVLDSTFRPDKLGDKLIGCMMRCANCGTFVKHQCINCPAIGAIEIDSNILVDGEPYMYSVLACDHSDNTLLVKGLRKFQFNGTTKKWGYKGL